MKWQPMDEAPKQPLNEIGEGPRILLRVDKEIMLGFWLTADDDEASCWWVQGSATGNVSPSAWFPLPSDEDAPSPLSATTTRNLACIKLHLEIAEVSKRTQALMPSIVNFKDALRRLAEVEAALAEYDATKEKHDG